MAVDVEVMGQTYTVSSADGEEHVRRMAAFVDGKMREIAGSGRLASSFTVAVMALLNIASEYHKLREEHALLEREIDRFSERVAEQLNRVEAERGFRKETAN